MIQSMVGGIFTAAEENFFRILDQNRGREVEIKSLGAVPFWVVGMD
jgi:hypothetical protein